MQPSESDGVPCGLTRLYTIDLHICLRCGQRTKSMHKQCAEPGKGKMWIKKNKIAKAQRPDRSNPDASCLLLLASATCQRVVMFCSYRRWRWRRAARGGTQKASELCGKCNLGTLLSFSVVPLACLHTASGLREDGFLFHVLIYLSR